jgi:hypothetical protein
MFTIMMNIFYSAALGWYDWGFYFNWLGWIVLLTGFVGAYKKDGGLLLLVTTLC